jgi:preprotein translocase subunit YajC
MNTNGTFSLLIFALPLLLLGWLFFTQNKRMRQMREFSSALNVGDQVITSSGIYGSIKHLDDTSAWLEIAEGTTIRVDRRAIAMKQTDSATGSTTAPTTATDAVAGDDTGTDDAPGTTPGSPQSGQ